MDIELLTTIVGWTLFLVILLGSVGNILSFIVWTKGKECKTYPAAVYLSFLSISDTMVLLSTSYFAVRFVTKINFRQYFEGMACRLIPGIHGLLIHFSMMMLSYIVVCLALERVFVVRWPLKAAIWTSKRKSITVLVFLTVFSCALNILWLFAYKQMSVQTIPMHGLSGTTPVTESSTNGNELLALLNNESVNKERNEPTSKARTIKIAQRPNENISDVIDVENNNITSRNSTAPYEEETKTNAPHQEALSTAPVDETHFCQFDTGSFLAQAEKEWHVWLVDFVILFCVPITIITTCNIILVSTVIRERRRLYSLDSSCSSDLKIDGSGSMTARIVAVCVVHSITVGLGSIANVILEFKDNIGQVDWITFADNLFTCLWFMNTGCNFILYSLFGTAFRSDFRTLFCKRRHICNMS